MLARVTNLGRGARGFHTVDRGTVLLDPGALGGARPRRPSGARRLERGRRRRRNAGGGIGRAGPLRRKRNPRAGHRRPPGLSSIVAIGDHLPGGRS